MLRNYNNMQFVQHLSAHHVLEHIVLVATTLVQPALMVTVDVLTTLSGIIAPALVSSS